jgi:hypothetical protein
MLVRACRWICVVFGALDLALCSGNATSLRTSPLVPISGRCGRDRTPSWSCVFCCDGRVRTRQKRQTMSAMLARASRYILHSRLHGSPSGVPKWEVTELEESVRGRVWHVSAGRADTRQLQRRKHQLDTAAAASLAGDTSLFAAVA